MEGVERIPVNEGAPTKARRYLVESRLTITEVNQRRVRATCRGEGAIYRLGWEAGQWGCTCPARSTRCSHLLALKSVVAPDL